MPISPWGRRRVALAAQLLREEIASVRFVLRSTFLAATALTGLFGISALLVISAAVAGALERCARHLTDLHRLRALTAGEGELVFAAAFR